MFCGQLYCHIHKLVMVPSNVKCQIFDIKIIGRIFSTGPDEADL